MIRFRTHIAVKVICSILVFTFVALDIAWANPPEHDPSNSTLAASSLMQQNPLNEEFRQSVFSQSALLASVFDIGEYCLGRKDRGMAPLPVDYAKSVIDTSLGKPLSASGIEIVKIVSVAEIKANFPETLEAALDEIGFKGKLPDEGVVFILYKKGDKRFLVQIAKRDDVSPADLPGYEWVVSDKYTVKYLPVDYAAPQAAVSDLSLRGTPSEARGTEAIPSSGSPNKIGGNCNVAEGDYLLSDSVLENGAQVIRVPAGSKITGVMLRGGASGKSAFADIRGGVLKFNFGRTEKVTIEGVEIPSSHTLMDRPSFDWTVNRNSLDPASVPYKSVSMGGEELVLIHSSYCHPDQLLLPQGSFTGMSFRMDYDGFKGHRVFENGKLYIDEAEAEAEKSSDAEYSGRGCLIVPQSDCVSVIVKLKEGGYIVRTRSAGEFKAHPQVSEPVAEVGHPTILGTTFSIRTTRSFTPFLIGGLAAMLASGGAFADTFGDLGQYLYHSWGSLIVAWVASVAILGIIRITQLASGHYLANEPDGPSKRTVIFGILKIAVLFGFGELFRIISGMYPGESSISPYLAILSVWGAYRLVHELFINPIFQDRKKLFEQTPASNVMHGLIAIVAKSGDVPQVGTQAENRALISGMVAEKLGMNIADIPSLSDAEIEQAMGLIRAYGYFEFIYTPAREPKDLWEAYHESKDLWEEYHHFGEQPPSSGIYGDGPRQGQSITKGVIIPSKIEILPPVVSGIAEPGPDAGQLEVNIRDEDPSRSKNKGPGSTGTLAIFLAAALAMGSAFSQDAESFMNAGNALKGIFWHPLWLAFIPLAAFIYYLHRSPLHKPLRSDEYAMSPSVLNVPDDERVARTVDAIEMFIKHGKRPMIHLDRINSNNGEGNAVVQKGGKDTTDKITPKFQKDVLVECRRRKIYTPPLFDLHIMDTEENVTRKSIAEYIDNASGIITLHWEGFRDKDKLLKLLRYIRSRGVMAGLAVNPDTPRKDFEYFVMDNRKHIDMILQMSVHPGLGGQSFMPSVLGDIKILREVYGFDGPIEIDGGINKDTIKDAVKAGANIFVAGGAFFRDDKMDMAGLEEAHGMLTSSMESVLGDLELAAMKRTYEKARVRDGFRLKSIIGTIGLFFAALLSSGMASASNPTVIINNTPSVYPLAVFAIAALIAANIFLLLRTYRMKSEIEGLTIEAPKAPVSEVLPEKTVVNNLFRELKNPKIEVVMAALGGLERLGVPRREIAARLGDALKSPNWQTRDFAINMLKRYGITEDQMFRAWLKALYDPDGDVVRGAIYGLGKLGDRRATPYLVEKLDALDRKTVVNAIFALGELRDKSAAVPLSGKLSSSDLKIVKRAEEALRKIEGSRRAILAGFGEAMRSHDYRTRDYAIAAFPRYGVKKEQMLSTWSRALSDPDKEVVKGAIYGLGKSGDRRVVPALIEKLHDTDEGVVMYAIYALGALRDRSAVAGLSWLRMSGNPYIVRRAEEALRNMGVKLVPIRRGNIMGESTRDISRPLWSLKPLTAFAALAVFTVPSAAFGQEVGTAFARDKGALDFYQLIGSTLGLDRLRDVVIAHPYFSIGIGVAIAVGVAIFALNRYIPGYLDRRRQEELALLEVLEPAPADPAVLAQISGKAGDVSKMDALASKTSAPAKDPLRLTMNDRRSTNEGPDITSKLILFAAAMLAMGGAWADQGVLSTVDIFSASAIYNAVIIVLGIAAAITFLFIIPLYIRRVEEREYVAREWLHNKQVFLDLRSNRPWYDESIQNRLAKNGFNIVTHKDDADFVIKVNAIEGIEASGEVFYKATGERRPFNGNIYYGAITKILYDFAVKYSKNPAPTEDSSRNTDNGRRTTDKGPGITTKLLIFAAAMLAMNGAWADGQSLLINDYTVSIGIGILAWIIYSCGAFLYAVFSKDDRFEWFREADSKDEFTAAAVLFNVFITLPVMVTKIFFGWIEKQILSLRPEITRLKNILSSKDTITKIAIIGGLGTMLAMGGAWAEGGQSLLAGYFGDSLAAAILAGLLLTALFEGISHLLSSPREGGGVRVSNNLLAVFAISTLFLAFVTAFAGIDFIPLALSVASVAASAHSAYRAFSPKSAGHAGQVKLYFNSGRGIAEPGQDGIWTVREEGREFNTEEKAVISRALLTATTRWLSKRYVLDPEELARIVSAIDGISTDRQEPLQEQVKAVTEMWSGHLGVEDGMKLYDKLSELEILFSKKLLNPEGLGSLDRNEWAGMVEDILEPQRGSFSPENSDFKVFKGGSECCKVTLFDKKYTVENILATLPRGSKVIALGDAAVDISFLDLRPEGIDYRPYYVRKDRKDVEGMSNILVPPAGRYHTRASYDILKEAVEKHKRGEERLTAIITDIDDCVAPVQEPIEQDMAELLQEARRLGINIYFITGGMFQNRYQERVIDRLETDIKYPDKEELRKDLERSHTKYTADGKAVFFEGVTLISSHPARNYPLFRELTGMVRNWPKVDGKDLVATVAEGSEHITLSDLASVGDWQSKYDAGKLNEDTKRAINKRAGELLGKGEFLDENKAKEQAVYEVMAERVHEVLRSFKGARAPVFVPDKVVAFRPTRMTRPLILSMKPKTEKDLEIVKEMLALIEKMTGLSAGKEFKAHVTLGYLVNPVYEDIKVFEDYASATGELDRIVKERANLPENEFTLRDIELSYFGSMDAFPAIAKFSWTDGAANAAENTDVVRRLRYLQIPGATGGIGRNFNAIPKDVLEVLLTRIGNHLRSLPLEMSPDKLDEAVEDMKNGIRSGRYCGLLKGEMADIVDENDGILYRTEIGFAHKLGLRHRTTNAFVVTPDGKIFLQRRAPGGRKYQLYLSIFGGHVKAGQSYDEGIDEELSQELKLGEGGLKGRLVLIRHENYDVDGIPNKENRALYAYFLTPEEYVKVKAASDELEERRSRMPAEKFRQMLLTGQGKEPGLNEVWSYPEVAIDELTSAESKTHRIVEDKRDAMLHFLRLTDRFKDGEEETSDAFFTPDLLELIVSNKGAVSGISALAKLAELLGSKIDTDQEPDKIRHEVSRLMDEIEAYVNNDRESIVAAANTLKTSMSHTGRVDGKSIDARRPSVEIKYRARQLIDSVAGLKNNGMPGDVAENMDKVRRGLDRLDADGIVSSVISITRRIARERNAGRTDSQKLLIGIGTGWIPGYSRSDSWQRKITNPFLSEIKTIIMDRVSRLGLGSVEIIVGEDDEVASELKRKADASGISLSNIVAVAERGSVESSPAFEPLRSTDSFTGAYLVGVDSSDLKAAYEMYGESMDEQIDIEMMEVLSVAVGFAAGGEIPDIPTVYRDLSDSGRRILIVVPRARIKKYEEIRTENNARKATLAAA